MEITIHPSLYEIIPNIKIGIIQYDNIAIADSPQMIKGRLQLFQESLYFDLEETSINDYKEIKEWRSIFKQLGKDPNRYRHSAEALYRRVKKQQFLPSLNSAADINNFFSLKYRIPIGIYDRAHISGNIEIRSGIQGEVFEGLNGRTNQLEKLMISADEVGPFGSPYVDSTRTAVTHATTSAIQIVYLSPSIGKEDAERMLASLMNMFIQVNGGEGSISILSSP